MKNRVKKARFSPAKGKPGTKKVVPVKRIVKAVRKVVNKVKGELMSFESDTTLANFKGKINILLAVDTATIKHRYGDFKAPASVMLFTHISTSGSTETYCQYRVGSQFYDSQIPNTLKVRVANEEERKEFNSHFVKLMKSDPITALSHSFTIGADPEVFVGNKDGKLMNAFDFLPSKTAPVKGPQGNRAYWDGFQAEFDLPMPAPTCLDTLTFQVRTGLQLVLSEARKKDKGAKLLFNSVMDIDPVLLAEGKEEHVQFGCMPSFNAYNMKGADLNGREVSFRPAGGHMHFGIGETTQEEGIRIVRALDGIIGVASVSMFGKWDDPRRRALYGLAGEFRLPKHGLEYRVLSNAWVMHPLMCYMSFDLARKAVRLGQLGLFEESFKTPQEKVIQVINDNDIEGARAIMQENKELFIQLLTAAYRDKEKGRVAFGMWMLGGDAIVKSPQDIDNNWGIERVSGDVYSWINEGRRFHETWGMFKSKVS